MTFARNLADLARRVVGTLAGNLLALDANAKIPAVDGSQITGVVRKRVSSGLLTPVLGSLLTWSHGLGAKPTRTWATLVCQTAEFGYSVGDEIEEPAFYNTINGTGAGLLTKSDASNVYCRVGSSTIVIYRWDAGSGTDISLANWKIRLWAELS